MRNVLFVSAAIAVICCASFADARSAKPCDVATIVAPQAVVAAYPQAVYAQPLVAAPLVQYPQAVVAQPVIAQPVVVQKIVVQKQRQRLLQNRQRQQHHHH